MRYKKRKTKKNHQPTASRMAITIRAPRFHRQAQRRVPCAEHRGPGRLRAPGSQRRRQEAPGVGQKSSPLLLPPPGAPLPREKLGGLLPPKECLESGKYMMFGEKLFRREQLRPPLAFLKPKLLEKLPPAPPPLGGAACTAVSERGRELGRDTLLTHRLAVCPRRGRPFPFSPSQ